MFYLIKNPNGQYMSTGRQYVNSSGFMENPPVFVDDRDSAWVSQFLASRRSTRDFLPTPIPQEILDQILTDALTAPSWLMALTTIL